MSANGEDIRSVIVKRGDSCEGRRIDGSRWEMSLRLDGRCWGRRRGIKYVRMGVPGYRRFRRSR